MHDGPGVRTTIFFKGCSLKCQWCHNPESISSGIETEWKPFLCLGCGDCTSVCTSHARYAQAENLVYDRTKCIACGKCAEICVSEAVTMVGRYMTAESIVKEAKKDMEMYRITGGGVTCSGGEPLLQPDAVSEVLCKLKQENIHTAVDTAGNVPWIAFEKVLPYTDLFLFDIKHMDEEMHRKYTGASNRQILNNFEHIPEEKDIFVRVPVVKGVNDDCLKQIADFLKGRTNVRLVELLPYHALGASKYAGLGKQEKKFASPDTEVLEEAVRYFEKCGIAARAAGMH